MQEKERGSFVLDLRKGLSCAAGGKKETMLSDCGGTGKGAVAGPEPWGGKKKILTSNGSSQPCEKEKKSSKSRENSEGRGRRVVGAFWFDGVNLLLWEKRKGVGTSPAIAAGGKGNIGCGSEKEGFGENRGNDREAHGTTDLYWRFQGKEGKRFYRQVLRAD